MVAGRLGRMGVVAGIHLAVFFFIAKGLGIVPTLQLPDTITTIPVDDPAVPDDPLPVVGPQLQTPTDIRVPMPDDPVYDNTQENVIVAQPVIEGGETQTGTALPQPQIVAVRQDARHPLSQPPYPSSQIRAGNQGNADVEVYVLPNGRVGDARIVRSTGFDPLDQSALDEAKRNWRLTPATRDGVPFAQWYRVRVTFKITDRQGQ